MKKTSIHRIFFFKNSVAPTTSPCFTVSSVLDYTRYVSICMYDAPPPNLAPLARLLMAIFAGARSQLQQLYPAGGWRQLFLMSIASKWHDVIRTQPCVRRINT